MRKKLLMSLVLKKYKGKKARGKENWEDDMAM